MKIGKLRFIIIVWFLFMYECCLCRFVVEKNSLKVTSPEKLKNAYECAIANFGIPKYGGTLSGYIVYPKSNQNACNNFTDDISLKSKTPGHLPVFLLVDRGGNNTILIIYDVFLCLFCYIKICLLIMNFPRKNLFDVRSVWVCVFMS